MIPPEYRTPLLAKAYAELTETADFRNTSPIGQDDIILIGEFVQSYNYIELHLRRSIEFFSRSGLLGQKDKGKSIHEVSAARLIPLVKQGVSSLPSEQNDLADTQGKLDEIELRRGFRNMFAHFAARAFKDDFLVFITRSDYDARQATGTPLGDDGILAALVEREHVRWLACHIKPYEAWLADRADAWRSACLRGQAI
ncbi:hypothetical protein [Sinorhizobium meliloti]|uniref:hypothetical protein n=1 Tax=Rhizobium meliloti TaxID=382 RepID=UPI001294A598|nr:hypothetical protein [Sinorhizobium meliloti]MQU69090.1 hypothetical protein [Sinorhizobium meliloti]